MVEKKRFWNMLEKGKKPHVLSRDEARQIILDGFFLARGNLGVSNSLYHLIGLYFPLEVKYEDQPWLLQQTRNEYGKRVKE